MSRPYVEVDVFSPVPYLGNPVAVVLDSDGLSDEAMQRLAIWTNLSETTFLLSPTTPEADYRLRIFTPGGELPFAGHPTLGSAHAWLEANGAGSTDGLLVQECGVGLVRLQLGDSLAFAAPPTIRSGPLDDDLVTRIADSFGLGREAILDHQWVVNGPQWAAVRLASAAEVLALEPDFSKLAGYSIGVIGDHPADSAFAYEVRAFATDIGVTEDPVTGSLNASLAQWLARTGAVPSRYQASQGARVGRAGIIDITIEPTGQVWVGGATNTLVRGTIEL